MDALLDYLYLYIPDITITLSTLLPNTAKPALVTDINIQYCRIYTHYSNTGNKIVLADMANALEVSDLINNTHPDNKEY